MSAEPGNVEPMFEQSERWMSPLAPGKALAAISDVFASQGVAVEQDGNSLTVRRGSNWKYRLWGNLFSIGRRNIPVALTLSVTSSAEGSDIEAHAFDTFGGRLVEHAFFGAQETFEEQLDNLLSTAAEAARVASRHRTVKAGQAVVQTKQSPLAGSLLGKWFFWSIPIGVALVLLLSQWIDPVYAVVIVLVVAIPIDVAVARLRRQRLVRDEN